MPTSNNANNGSSSSKPPLRGFQYDSSGIGSLPSAVNLFTGDLNLPQSLFTLPGRTRNSRLDLNLTISYQSDVERDAGTWNRDAPTGVLGLGWSLPLTWIEADSSGSPVPATRSYTYYNSGSGTPLVQQPQQPLLFRMDASLQSGLVDGAAVPSDILGAFRSNGLALSASALVSQVTDQPGAGSGWQQQAFPQAKGSLTALWLVDDADLQQQFLLGVGDDLYAYAGGQAFQLQSFQFYQILYFDRYERWLVVDDSGLRKSFGGLAATTDEGFKTGVGNSIAWSVWWAGASGQPLWSGPSTVSDGQVQVARAWYLASTSDRFGDSVQYRYNGWSRNADGLIPDAEQPVGAAGLPYTKAVYLTGMTDVFGRTVTLQYGDKLWNSADDQPREYADPHRATPSNDPNAYQDQYQTKYLDGIAVSDANGDSMLSIEFQYQPSPGTDWPAVAEVAGLAGSLKGDSYKRFLTGIVTRNADGDALPGLQYEYCLDSTGASCAQRGAMTALTYPQGARAEFTYRSERLDACQRTQAVAVADVPAMVSSGTPRVFFGPDYVVSTWFNSGSNQLSMQVYTWLGRWIGWQLDPDDAVLDSGGLDLTSLGVVAGQDFFALHFDQPDSDLSKVYLFTKNIGIPGRWQPAAVDGQTTAKDQPARSYSLTAGEAQYYGGASFFFVLQFNPSSNSGAGERVSWNWSTRAWTVLATTLTQMSWAAVGSEYIFVLSNDGSSGAAVSLSYLDGEQVWQQTSASIAFAGVYEYSDVSLAGGSAMVAINQLAGANSQEQQYTTTLVQWDADHRIQDDPFCAEFYAYFSPNDPAPSWAPQVVDDTLVATGGNLLRFNGQTWLKNTGLALTGAIDGMTQRFSYGPDFAVCVWAYSNGAPAAYALSFDPDSLSTDWSTQPASPSGQLTQTTDTTANWPWAGNDRVAVIGPNVYLRGSNSDWQTAFAAGPAVQLASEVGSGQSFESQSLVNQGPDFLTYAVYDGSDASQRWVQSILFQNGGVVGDGPQSFTDERIFTPGQEAESGSGTASQGPQSFVGYAAAAADFDLADTIYLHRYAGYAVDGLVSDFPVVQLQLFDGFGGGQPVTTVSYQPDTSTAACDASGENVQYFQNTLVPGSDDPSQTPFGKKVVSFLNGLGDTSGDNAYDMLNGMQLQSQTFAADGSTLLESHSNSWQVVLDVASDPTDPSAPTIALRGGWVTQTGQSATQNGVGSSQSSDFIPSGLPAPYTGQPATRTVTTWNGQGQQEVHQVANRYGVEVYDPLRALNVMSASAGKTSTIQVGQGGSAVTVRSTAATYASWPSQAGDGVCSPAREASFHRVGSDNPQFPFSSYVAGQVPDGWQLRGRVIDRSVYGQVLELQDACGVSGATLLSAAGEFPVARVKNAAAGEFAYYGFEAYEDGSAWNLTGVLSDSDDARTGSSAGRLPGGSGARLGVTITPANRSQVYLLGCWYKTASGFTPGPGSGCTLTPTTDGSAGQPLFSGFEDSGGDWQYLSVGVPLTAGDASLALQLEVVNGAATDLLIDSLFLVPLTGGLLAKSYDSALHQVLTLMDSGGRVRRSCYDRFAQPSVQVGLNGAPSGLSMNFLSGQGSADGGFDAASPSATLNLTPAGGGSLETFRDGGAWQQRWQVQTAADWSAGDGALQFSGTAADALTWTGPAPSGDTWALYFEVQPQTESPSLSVSVDGIGLSYSGGAYSSEAVSPLSAPPAMARHWLLVRGDGLLLLFGDGQLLFSASVTFGTGGLSITPASAMDFRHLATFDAPRLSLTYLDGAGRQRQVQQLHGADCLVAQVVYDAIGRTLAVTRTAPGSFGSGAALAPLQYRPGFIDEAAFLGNLDGSWVLPGDLADYYAGQSDADGALRSDDQGYSYLGTRWEASPRAQPLELGQPGADYAIANVDTSTTESRSTTQLVVGASDGSTVPLPAGLYQQNGIITPVKNQGVQLLDQRGRSMAYAALDSRGALVARSGVSRSYGGGACGLEAGMLVQMPNALVSGPQSNDDDYTQTSTLDPLGRTLANQDPDSGTTQMLYDSCGRQRFVQPALESGQTGFIYYRYDRAGRLVEEGWLDQAWDASSLQAHADDFAWPAAADAPQVKVSWSYDGSGDDRTLIGHKTRATTTNGAPSLVTNGQTLTSTETFTYTLGGMVASCTLALSGPSSQSGTVGYEYNNLGELTRLTPPAGAPLAQVCYGYDDIGRITAIGSSQTSPSDLAGYRYSADSKVQVETLGGGAWTRTMQYLSPGWPRQVEAQSQDGSQSFTLTYSYQADGTYDTRTLKFDFAADSAEQSASFSFDAQGHLLQVSGADGATETYDYDPNGNLWSVDAVDGSDPGDTRSVRFPLVGGSNRLLFDGSGSFMAGAYDAQGRLESGLGGQLVYQDCTGLTAGWAFGTRQTQLGYGGHRQRLFKRVQQDDGSQTSDTVYFCGPASDPVARVDAGSWTLFVQGPTGVVAMVTAAATRFPLKDNVGTVWAVVDSAGGLVARYEYAAYGAVKAVAGSDPQGSVYRFQGRELDAEAGLYNFGDRMYAPALCRFLSPDPQRQFPSPYVFAANNPFQVTDATGDISTWGEVGLGVAMGAVFVTGLALTVVTAGAAAPVAAAADAAAAGSAAAGAAAVGAEVATDAVVGAADTASAVGAAAGEGAVEGLAESGSDVLASVSESGVAGASESGGEAGIEGSASAGTELSSGPGEVASDGGAAAGADAEPASESSGSWSSKLKSAGRGVAGSSLTKAGSSGLKYEYQNGGDFSMTAFLEAVGIGAVSGAVTGVFGELTKPLGPFVGERCGPAGKFATKTLLGGISGAIGKDVTTSLTNLTEGKPWYQGLVKSTAVGFDKGALVSWATGGATSLVETNNSSGAAILKVKKMAVSTGAFNAYFYMADQFVVWGQSESWGKQQ